MDSCLKLGISESQRTPSLLRHYTLNNVPDLSCYSAHHHTPCPKGEALCRDLVSSWGIGPRIPQACQKSNKSRTLSVSQGSWSVFFWQSAKPFSCLALKSVAGTSETLQRALLHFSVCRRALASLWRLCVVRSRAACQAGSWQKMATARIRASMEGGKNRKRGCWVGLCSELQVSRGHAQPDLKINHVSIT